MIKEEKTKTMVCLICGHNAGHIIKSETINGTPKKVYCMYCGQTYNRNVAYP